MVKRIVVDTETTGINDVKNQILTVGILATDINPKTGETKDIDTLHVKIKYNKEEFEVQYQALAVNGIDLKEHNASLEAMTETDACLAIRSFVKRHLFGQNPILGQNLPFDIGFLKALFKRRETPYPFGYRTIDTMGVWMALKDVGLVPYTLGNKLEHMADFYNISYEGAHDAVADCKITAKVYGCMLKAMQGVEQGCKLCSGKGKIMMGEAEVVCPECGGKDE